MLNTQESTSMASSAANIIKIFPSNLPDILLYIGLQNQLSTLSIMLNNHAIIIVVWPIL